MGARSGKNADRGRKTRPAGRTKAASPGMVRRAAKTVHPTDRDPKAEFSAEEWHDMVATAAYFRAQARGFEGGSAEEDWYEAEAQLREQFARAEDEADERAEAGLDLRAHREEEQTRP
jgi:hypothetical protein